MGYDSIMATKLQQIREERKLTRYQVAKATGLAYNTVKRLEVNAGDAVNLVNLKVLADFYGQPLDVRHLLGVG
jgi:transcriptional regulator with XRE-family HTH domain